MNTHREFDGLALKLWRVAQRKTQRQVALDLDVSDARVSDWERGIRTPTEAQLARLKEILAR